MACFATDTICLTKEAKVASFRQKASLKLTAINTILMSNANELEKINETWQIADNKRRRMESMKKATEKEIEKNISSAQLHAIETQSLLRERFVSKFAEAEAVNSEVAIPGCALLVRANEANCLLAAIALEKNEDSIPLETRTSKQVATRAAAPKRKKPARPLWMPPSLYAKSSMKTLNTETIECKGCHRKFVTDHQRHEFAYHFHCMEESNEFKKLALIAPCPHCPFKFLNAQALRLHLTLNHKGLLSPGPMPPRPI